MLEKKILLFEWLLWNLIDYETNHNCKWKTTFDKNGIHSKEAKYLQWIEALNMKIVYLCGSKNNQERQDMDISTHIWMN